MNRVEIYNQEYFDIQDDHIIKIVDDSLCIFNQTDCFVELNFVSKSKIAELNRDFRQIDSPTDVLSFPQTDLKNSEIKVLGDIVISLEIVAEKDEKMDDVIKHGLLHLLGYDHEIDASAWQKAADKIGCQY